MARFICCGSGQHLVLPFSVTLKAALLAKCLPVSETGEVEKA